MAHKIKMTYIRLPEINRVAEQFVEFQVKIESVHRDVSGNEFIDENVQVQDLINQDKGAILKQLNAKLDNVKESVAATVLDLEDQIAQVTAL